MEGESKGQSVPRHTRFSTGNNREKFVGPVLQRFCFDSVWRFFSGVKLLFLAFLAADDLRSMNLFVCLSGEKDKQSSA